MFWTVIGILVILWLLGFLGPSFSSRIPRTGYFVHVLIVIAIVLVVLRLLRIV